MRDSGRENRSMTAEQKFMAFLHEWAKKKRCTFVEESPDQHECDHLIDGMATVDTWGWLLPEGTTEKNDDFFGCVEWHEVNGCLELTWNSY